MSCRSILALSDWFNAGSSLISSHLQEQKDLMFQVACQVLASSKKHPPIQLQGCILE